MHKRNISLIFTVVSAAMLLTACANDKFRCGPPENGLSCTKSSDVYKIKVLGENPADEGKDVNIKTTIRREDGAHVLTQGEILDRQIHQFQGSLQQQGGDGLTIIPLTRDPVYRTIYIPGETYMTAGGKPMRSMPRVIIVEQLPGGFIDGPYGTSDAVNPLQMEIPIKSMFQAPPRKTVKKEGK